jgi:dolichol-phosphate mannosyltransferase
MLLVIIPARDEAGCIASAVEHLHLELAMHGIPHEIVVVDDGSTDNTWDILVATTQRIEKLVPVKNAAPHGFGRALQRGSLSLQATRSSS